MKGMFYKFSVVLSTIFCFLFQTKLGAQSYIFSPAKTYIAMVDTSQLNYNGIEINNTSVTDLDFTWELFSVDTLIDCEFDLCNSGFCFSNLPLSGIMPTIVPGQKGFLKMHMFSGQTNGVNTIKYVLKNANLFSSDTLTFIIIVGDVTGLMDHIGPGIETFIYPNPTNNESALIVTLVEESNVTVTIVNTVGQVVHSSSSDLTIGTNKLQLDTKNLASGIYSVVVTSVNGSVTKKLSVTNK